MQWETVIVSIENKIALVTLNRPESLNALNAQLIQELHDVLQHFKEDASVRVVLITGSGQKSFVAGADIKEFKDFSPSEGEHLARSGQEKLFDYIENFPKPVIALVNGFALGGGLELAMSCHFRIASENAKMGLPEVTLGLIPGYGGTQRLPMLVGRGRAYQMMTTAEAISAEKALSWGLVNEVVTQDELISRGKAIAEKIAANSPAAIKSVLECVRFSPSSEGFEKEKQLFGKLFQTEEFKEGVGAFLEKRKPNF